jgi:hypothetical protein
MQKETEKKENRPQWGWKVYWPDEEKSGGLKDGEWRWEWERQLQFVTKLWQKKNHSVDGCFESLITLVFTTFISTPLHFPLSISLQIMPYSTVSSPTPSTRFYILLTVHLVMIHDKWQTWRTILFYVFISILYMFRTTSCSSSGDRFVCRSERNFQTCTRNGHRHRVAYIRYCIDTVDYLDDGYEVARNV